MTLRSVKRLFPALRDDIGELRTQRPLPNRERDQIDPFLFLNHHGPQIYPPENEGLPFGPHPHRGFQTVTFIVQGSLLHRDTGGHESVMTDGGVQWMVAGRGLEHAELSPEEFLRSGGPLEILQLWVNLPAALKMIEPTYTGLQREEIPIIPFDDGRGRLSLISGVWGDQTGPVTPPVAIFMSSVELVEKACFRAAVPSERSIFLYVMRGAIDVGGIHASALNLVEFSDDGDEVELVATEPSFLLFGHATPFGEPVVSHGPFVMNSVEEIMQAIRDYQAGSFS